MHAAREGNALTHTAEIEALPDGPARSELLGLLAFARDEVTASRDLLVAARAGMVDGTVPGESVARLDLELAYVHCQLGDGEAAVRAADDTRRQIPEGHRLAPLARAFLAAGTALTEGPARGLEHLAFLPTSPARATPYELAALTQRGILNGLLGRLAPACADLTVVARRRGTPLAHLLGCPPRSTSSGATTCSASGTPPAASSRSPSRPSRATGAASTTPRSGRSRRSCTPGAASTTPRAPTWRAPGCWPRPPTSSGPGSTSRWPTPPSRRPRAAPGTSRAR